MKDSYDPLRWGKTGSEGDMSFELTAERSDDGKQVKLSTGLSYPFPERGFTVFSATHFLASRASDPTFFPAELEVFVDGEIWQAKAYRFDVDHPHPDHRIKVAETLILTDLHFLQGKSALENNDILTSVIATEGTQFLLWVAQDGHYTKAQFGRFPKSVILDEIAP